MSSDGISTANIANIANAANTANTANITNTTSIASIASIASDIDVMPLPIDMWYVAMGGQLAEQLYDTFEMNI